MRHIKKSFISVLLAICIVVTTIGSASASISVTVAALVGAAIASATGVTVAIVDSENQYFEEEPRGGMFDSWYRAKTSVAYSSGGDNEWAYGNQQKEFSTSKPCYVRVGSAVQAPWHWGWWWGEGGNVVITYRLTGANNCDIEVADGFLTSVESDDPNVLIFKKDITAKKEYEEEVVIFKYSPKGVGSVCLEVIYDNTVKSEFDNKSTVYFVDDTNYE